VIIRGAGIASQPATLSENGASEREATVSELVVEAGHHQWFEMWTSRRSSPDPRLLPR